MTGYALGAEHPRHVGFAVPWIDERQTKGREPCLLAVLGRNDIDVTEVLDGIHHLMFVLAVRDSGP
jgi:hypothetical protein